MKFLIIFKEGSLPFHLPLNPTNYVTGPHSDRKANDVLQEPGQGWGNRTSMAGRGGEKPHGHSTSGGAECPVDRQDSPEGATLGSKAEAMMAIWAGGVLGHHY